MIRHRSGPRTNRDTSFSLPLAKASIATDPSASKSYSWKHATENVVAVFDSFPASAASPIFYCEPRVLKIVQDATVLVRIVVTITRQSKLTFSILGNGRRR